MAEHAETNSGLILTNSKYDVLRQLVEKVFPGLGVLYAAIATIWGFGYVVEVGGTFAALSVFGGIILSLARNGYAPVSSDVFSGPFDGQVVEEITPEGQSALRLELNSASAENLLNKEHLIFKGLNSSSRE